MYVIDVVTTCDDWLIDCLQLLECVEETQAWTNSYLSSLAWMAALSGGTLKVWGICHFRVLGSWLMICENITSSVSTFVWCVEFVCLICNNMTGFLSNYLKFGSNMKTISFLSPSCYLHQPSLPQPCWDSPGPFTWGSSFTRNLFEMVSASVWWRLQRMLGTGQCAGC